MSYCNENKRFFTSYQVYCSLTTFKQRDEIFYNVLLQKQAIGHLFIEENVGNVIKEPRISFFLLHGNKCSFILRKKRISVKTLGKVEPTIKTVYIVQINVLNPIKSVVIEAICVPFICSDILSQKVHSVASQYEHLQNLTLADSSPDGNKCIQILVGVDYCYSCIGSEIKRVSGNQFLAIGFYASVMKFHHPAPRKFPPRKFLPAMFPPILII